MKHLEITVSDRVWLALDTIALRLGKSIETIAEEFIRDGAFAFKDETSDEFATSFRK